MKKQILLFIGLALLSFKNHAQTVTDIEGTVYNTLQFGTKLWMKENLRTGTYNDGTPIFFPGTTNALWASNSNGAYSWYMNDSATYSNLFGACYNWYAVSPTTNGGKNVCPLNWHVPTHDEWTVLERAICTSSSCATDFPFDITTGGFRGTDEGNKLKEAGNANWSTPSAGTNSSMFTARPGGKRDQAGAFSSVHGNYAFFWTSTSFDATYAWFRGIAWDNTAISRVHGFNKSNGFSVRCVSDFSVSVDEINFENEIQVYPNPATEMITIDNALAQPVNMQLYNMMGQVVDQNTLSTGKNEIDVRLLPKGIYFIRISSTEGEYQKKILIK